MTDITFWSPSHPDSKYTMSVDRLADLARTGLSEVSTGGPLSQVPADAVRVFSLPVSDLLLNPENARMMTRGLLSASGFKGPFTVHVVNQEGFFSGRILFAIVPEAVKSPLSPMQLSAIQLHETFTALMDAGFTESQALFLISQGDR